MIKKFIILIFVITLFACTPNVKEKRLRDFYNQMDGVKKQELIDKHKETTKEISDANLFGDLEKAIKLSKLRAEIAHRLRRTEVEMRHLNTYSYNSINLFIKKTQFKNKYDEIKEETNLQKQVILKKQLLKEIEKNYAYLKFLKTTLAVSKELNIELLAKFSSKSGFKEEQNEDVEKKIKSLTKLKDKIDDNIKFVERIDQLKAEWREL